MLGGKQHRFGKYFCYDDPANKAGAQFPSLKPGISLVAVKQNDQEPRQKQHQYNR